MPYWNYKITQKGRCELRGEQADYSRKLLKCCQLDCYMDFEYDGKIFDAGSKFPDDVSAKIAPFNIEGRKDFDAAYLYGFYAETADVDAEVYREEAINEANRRSIDYLKQVHPFDTTTVQEDQPPSRLNTQCSEEGIALLPVWFMSYRNKNRVAYATVNGQTGKACADVPVDFKKYILGSLLLALPIFFMLNLILTGNLSVVLLISSFVSMLLSIFSVKELRKIQERKMKVNDVGYMALNYSGVTIEKIELSNYSGWIGVGMLAVIFGPILWYVFGNLVMGIVWWLIIGGTMISAIDAYNWLYKEIPLSKMAGLCANIVATFVAFVVCLAAPTNISWYVFAILFLSVSEIIAFIDVIEFYNVLTTRKLPQFAHKGGDDRA